MVAIPDVLQHEYVQFAVILFLSLFAARLFLFLFSKYMTRFTQRTKTDLDDLLIKTVTTPVYALIIAIGIYFSLRVLSFFQASKSLLDSIFFVVFVLISAFLLSRVLALFINRWLKVQKQFERTPKLVNKVIVVIIYILAFLMILSHFDIEITPLLATLGIGGLALGLALQNTLSNFFAGLHIISDHPVYVGNYIELEGVDVSGYVEDIGWRSTRIRTLPNTIVVIPNAKLAESIIINDSLPDQELAVLVQCGVAYGSDLKKVERVTVEVAKQVQKRVPGAVQAFEPFIRYHTFGDSNINFTVILRAEKFVEKYLITHEFIKALKEAYDKEKIEISFPVRKIYSAK